VSAPTAAVPAAGNYDESSGEDYAICMGITR